jgi:hypothetical protein
VPTTSLCRRLFIRVVETGKAAKKAVGIEKFVSTATFGTEKGRVRRCKDLFSSCTTPVDRYRLFSFEKKRKTWKIQKVKSFQMSIMLMVLRKINKRKLDVFFAKLCHVSVKRVFWLHTTSDENVILYENVSTQTFLSDFKHRWSFRPFLDSSNSKWRHEYFQLLVSG